MINWLQSIRIPGTGYGNHKAFSGSGSNRISASDLWTQVLRSYFHENPYYISFKTG